MSSQLLYIATLEQNLERYEKKVKEGGTVSDRLKEYIARRKKEIAQMKNNLMAKVNQA